VEVVLGQAGVENFYIEERDVIMRVVRWFVLT
jgi:hypothetical protein